MPEPHKDLSWDDAQVMGTDLISGGATVHFKFTCTNCGERCTFQESNRIYKNGECNACGFENIDIQGYGLVVIY